MNGKVVFVSHKEFMELFMSSPGIPPLPEGFATSLGLRNIPFKLDSEMCMRFMDKFNTFGLAPGFRFIPTLRRADPNDSASLQTYGAMYLDDGDSTGGPFASGSRIELLIECKANDVTEDPFDDTTESGEPNSDEMRKALGPVMSFACEVFKKQHRTHQFTLMMMGSSARIVRWDRSGVVATRKFDYMEEPEKLVEFIWIFARLPGEKRGIDPTVARVDMDSEDWKLMQDRSENARLLAGKFAVQEHARKAFKESLRDSNLWKIRVDECTLSGAESAEAVITPRYFLVGEPTFASDRLLGRGTRGYVAIDLNDRDGPFVFLKDVWRVDCAGSRREGDMLGFLNERGVKNIPTKVCHGDVDPLFPQTTVSQEVWKAGHPKDVDECPLKTHTHYRLVVREVCIPMDEFQNGRQLIFLISRCIGAHRDAYRQGVIHRDISGGNVLIDVKESVDEHGNFKQKFDGLLTDWELSKNLTDVSDTSRQRGHIGTWQFLSVNMLRDPKKKITIQDELESFFYLVLYYAIRYLPHNCSDVPGWMSDYFNDFTYMDEKYFGGTAKSEAISSGVLFVGGKPLKFYTSPPRESFPEPPAHPINQYFREQLLAFQAYHILYRMGHVMIQPATPSRPTTESSEEFSESEQSAHDWFSQNIRPRVEKTSPYERELLIEARWKHLQTQCKIVEDHTLMLDEYCDIWYLPGWPRISEKTADQMRRDFNLDKDKKKPGPSKSGIGSKTGESAPESSLEPRAGPSPIPAPVSSPPPTLRRASQADEGSSQGAEGATRSRKKRDTLHDGEPFGGLPPAKRLAPSL